MISETNEFVCIDGLESCSWCNRAGLLKFSLLATRGVGAETGLEKFPRLIGPAFMFTRIYPSFHQGRTTMQTAAQRALALIQHLGGTSCSTACRHVGDFARFSRDAQETTIRCTSAPLLCIKCLFSQKSEELGPHSSQVGRAKVGLLPSALLCSLAVHSVLWCAKSQVSNIVSMSSPTAPEQT